MKSKKMDMQALFSELSENNKDILILLAKSMKVAYESGARNDGRILQARENNRANVALFINDTE